MLFLYCVYLLFTRVCRILSRVRRERITLFFLQTLYKTAVVNSGLHVKSHRDFCCAYSGLSVESHLLSYFPFEKFFHSMMRILLDLIASLIAVSANSKNTEKCHHISVHKIYYFGLVILSIPFFYSKKKQQSYYISTDIIRCETRSNVPQKISANNSVNMRKK